MSEDQIGAGILRHKPQVNAKNLLEPPTIEIQESVEKPSVTFVLEDKSKSSESLLESNENIEENKPTDIRMPLSPTVITFGQRDTIDSIDGDDDYSASISAMLHRKPSRKSSSLRKRQSSLGVEDPADGYRSTRRRSSVFTTSSGDTAISIEADGDGEFVASGTQALIFEKLKIHKEALSAVKYQPWPLKKKVKLAKQAKLYIRSHEGALQERLAQSKSTRDALARVSIFFSKQFQYIRREVINLETWIIPWQHRIKEIESHFGSAVASYFTFLRWLFWINLVIFLFLTAFVMIPEILNAKQDQAGDRKTLFEEEKMSSKNFLTWWEFEGTIKHSPFFYGWYTNSDPTDGGYRLPLAYFLANLLVYTYSFVAILQKMAKNSRMSKLSEKEDECAFSWKLFTGWDFMIGNPETATNRVASNILSFKEALLEEAEKEKKLGHWKITSLRILVNLIIMSLLALSAYAVVTVVSRSTKVTPRSGWWRQNEITVVMSLISYIFPIFFEILGLLENYHPRKQLRLQLARIMVLNLLNLYSLIFALFDKISDMEVQLRRLRPKIPKQFLPPANFTPSHCQKFSVPCNELNWTSSDFAPTQITNHYPKKSALTMSLAAMSFILNPNITTNELINYHDLSMPRINDAPNEHLIGLDEFLDYGSDNLTNLSKINDVPPPPSVFDDVKWEGYNEKDIPQNNFEYEYDSDIFPDDEKSGRNSTTEEIGINLLNETDDSISTTTMQKIETTTLSGDENSGTLISTRKNEVYNTISDETVVPMTTEAVDDGVIKINVIKCFTRICDVHQDDDDKEKEMRYKNTRVSHDAVLTLNHTTRRKLRTLCWETMFGQELAKLTVMDLILTIIATLLVDFFRALFVRYINPWWCWDLEKQFPQYGDFKIAENILHLVNNQGMVWMGMFFSPGLIALNLIKLGILLYLRSWAVMTCNVPHEIVFRASRSNNFYLALLLTMLFLCVLPVGYAIVWVEPSWHCGPFAGYYRIYYIASQSLKNALPKKVHQALDYIASPGIVIPLIVLMALIIYYMISLAGSLREANNDLKIQLRYERTEERRKMFKIAEKQGQGQDVSLARWKKIFPMKIHNGDMSLSKSAEHVLRQKRQNAIESVRSISSDFDEATDNEPNSLQQDSLSPKIFTEIDNHNFSFSNGHSVKGKEIPKIKISSIDEDDTNNISALNDNCHLTNNNNNNCNSNNNSNNNDNINNSNNNDNNNNNNNNSNNNDNHRNNENDNINNNNNNDSNSN